MSKSPLTGGELTEFGESIFSQMDTITGHRGYTEHLRKEEEKRQNKYMVLARDGREFEVNYVVFCAVPPEFKRIVEA